MLSPSRLLFLSLFFDAIRCWERGNLSRSNCQSDATRVKQKYIIFAANLVPLREMHEEGIMDTKEKKKKHSSGMPHEREKTAKMSGYAYESLSPRS